MSRLLRKLAFCAKSEPKQKQTSDVECAVCQDEPNVPCTVPCGNHHVFCLACLQGLVTHNHYTTHFPCPLCRTRVRIPLGGVAAFKQGKGKGSKLLSRLPVIRPRCRRSSLESSSSGWPDDLSFSDVMVVEMVGFHTDSDDSDGLSSLGVPSEGGESIRALNLEEWFAPDNAYVEGQAAILEEIRQNRELSDHASQDEMVINNLQRSVSGESENASEGRDRQGRPVLTVTEDDSSSSDVDEIATSGEGLDMAVVLQLIADLERNESQEETDHATAEGTETTECQAQVSARSALSDCSETTEENDKTNDVDHSDSRGQHADWKSRTIVETVIPRPKLTTHCDTAWDERNFRLQHEGTNDEVGCAGIFPIEAGADLTHFEEDLDSLSLREQRKMLLLRKAKFDQYRGQMSTDQSKSSESEPSSAEEEDWNAQKLLLMNNASTDTATPSTDHVLENTASPAVSEESITDSLTRDNTDSKSSTTAGETLRLPEAGIRMPEEWRLCKRQKLRMTHVRRTASLPDNDLSLDTDIIISEDPVEWIKRIHSLRQCRRGQGSKRPITCSQSHGGKPATSGVRETETQTQVEDMPSKVEENGDKDSDGRGEDMQNVADCLDGETKDAVLSYGNKANNVTIIHV